MSSSDAKSDARPDFGEGYTVKLPVFEGPLDLLLHLIRQNEMDVTDIPIAAVAEQYLACIDLMRELNLDVAAEHLLMAAKLAWIKSRMLLPSVEEEEDGEAVDPRAELVERLLEYQRYKEVAENLGRRRMLGRDVFEAGGSMPEPTPDSEREIAVGLFELIEALRQVLAEGRDEQTAHAVESEHITVRERMIHVMDRLKSQPSMEFVDVLRDAEGRPPSRPVLIATFLAVLELARLMALSIYQGLGEQGAPYGPIRLRALSDSSAPDWHDRISDSM